MSFSRKEGFFSEGCHSNCILTSLVTYSAFCFNFAEPSTCSRYCTFCNIKEPITSGRQYLCSEHWVVESILLYIVTFLDYRLLLYHSVNVPTSSCFTNSIISATTITYSSVCSWWTLARYCLGFPIGGHFHCPIAVDSHSETMQMLRNNREQGAKRR